MAAGQAVPYSCNDVVVTLGGFIIDGFGPDDMVATEAQRDTVTHVEGADGQITEVIRRALPLHRVTLSLMQTSAANQLLALEHDAQRAPGYVPKPLKVENTLNGEKVFIARARIMRKPGVEYGTDAKVRQWILEGQGDSFNRGG